MALAYLALQLLLNMEPTLLAILTMVINVLGKEAYIADSGLHGLCLIKNLTPVALTSFPYEEKEYGS
jgi:hypothetical protein